MPHLFRLTQAVFALSLPVGSSPGPALAATGPGVRATQTRGTCQRTLPSYPRLAPGAQTVARVRALQRGCHIGLATGRVDDGTAWLLASGGCVGF